MADVTAPELLALLNRAVSLCMEWEQWSDQQFYALTQGNLEALLPLTAQQCRLADTLCRLDVEWRRLCVVPPASEGQGLFPARSPLLQHGELRAKYQEFLGAAERVFACNYRNVKALNLLNALGKTCEPLTVPRWGQSYDHKGSVGQKPAGFSAVVDRQG